MASQRFMVWFGILAVFLLMGGLLWLIYDSVLGPEIGPDFPGRGQTASNDPSAGSVRPETEKTGPDVPFRPRSPRRTAPVKPAEAPRAQIPGPKPGESAAADYGTLDDHLYSTKTPTFYGTVSDKKGPVGGARVVLFQEYPALFGYKALSRIKTDRKGQFVFSPTLVVPHGRYHLLIRVPEMASQFFWNLMPGKRFDVQLTEGKPLKGRVVDPEGESIADAQVIAQSKTWREVVKASPDGMFEFPHAPTFGMFKLTASADGFESGSVENVMPGGPGIEVKLVPGVPVQGTVTDGITKQPLTNATISIGLPGLPERIPKAGTDGNGRYVIRGVPSAFNTFFVKAPGYSEFMKPTKIDHTDQSATYDFQLFPVGEIRGKVVDMQGQPVAGAKVFIGIKNVFVYCVLDPKNPAAETDAGGEFYLPEMNTNPSFDCKLVAEHPDYRRGESSVLKPKPGELLEGITIQLQNGTAFKGRVIRQDGTPVENAEVKATSFTAQQFGSVYFGATYSPTPTTRTDEHGEFTLGRLSAGRVRIEVSAEGCINQQEMLEIPPEGIEGKVFTLEMGYSIAGRVTDTAGQSIPNARIHAACPHPVNSYSNAITNQEGYFTVKNLKQGIFSLTVRAAGYSEARKDGVQVGEPKADFALQANGRLSGLVTSAVTGAPVTEYTVNLQRRKMDGTYQWYRDFRQNQDNGQYELSDIEPGVFKMTIRSKEYASRVREGIMVASGTETTGVNFVLSAGCTITGKVTSAIGAVVKAAHVVAMPLNLQGQPDYQSQSRTERVKEDGSYQIRGLADGLYQVKPMAGGYCQSGGQRVQVGGEQTFQINLILNKGGFLRVHVTDRQGKAVPGANVVVIDSAGNRWGVTPGERSEGHGDPETTLAAGAEVGGEDDPRIRGDGTVTAPGNRTGMTGEFRLAQPLCPGPATIKVTAPGYRPADKVVNIVDETEVPCRVVLRQ